MKARFALLLVITIVCPAFDDDSEKPLTIGEWGHVRFGPSPACSKIETTERALVLGFYQDTEALIKYVMPRYASGECRPLSIGMEVQVEDTGVIHNALCVRVKGDTDCYWTKRVFIERGRREVK
jgi:hypothetical protein